MHLLRPGTFPFRPSEDGNANTSLTHVLISGSFSSQAVAPVSSVIPNAYVTVFPFENFNRIQSQCLTAFTTDNNLVVSAPTGSGKTVLFEMAICRELHCRPASAGAGGGVHGKCVYLAPIKALCAEKAADWRAKFAPLGLNVCLLTGYDGGQEWSASSAGLMRADIILSTPEKFDSVTRNHRGSIENSLVSTISLLLIDEVHHLADSRGPALEAVAARMLLTSDELGRSADRSISSMPAAGIRVLAASATIPNLQQVATWLRVPDASHCKVFAESYRPVPLKHHVLGYKSRNQWTFQKYLSGRCFQVVTKYAPQKPALVFCTSRSACFAAAKAFVDELHSKGPATSINRGNLVTQPLTTAERSALFESSARCSDKTNAELIRHGLAVHNAEISAEDRTLVESLFRKQLVRVLFCTSTLSSGVNLPARLVCILGTTLYQNGSMVEIDRNEVMQMMGRAGRPQFDTEGIAVIMTAMDNVRLYENICAGKHDMVNSQLELKLAEHVNAEVSRRVIVDVPSAILWLKCTFLYAQQRRAMRPTVLENATKEIVLRILNDLAKYGIVEYDDMGFSVRPLNASHLMARYYVSFPTMQTFVTEGSDATSEADLLRILSKSVECTDFLFVRRSEKKQLNELTLLLRYPLRTKVRTVEEKAYILLQCGLTVNGQELVSHDFNLMTETRKVAHIVKRLALTLSRYLLEREAPKACFTSCMAVLHVSRGIEAGIWWDGGSVIRQLKGVGPVAARKLVAGGVHSMKQLAQMDPRNIEHILKKNVPHGNDLLREVAAVPRFHARVEQVSQRAGEGGHAMDFRICITLIPWTSERKTDNAAGLGSKTHRGFLLVGSHSQAVKAYKQFTIASGGELSFDVTIYAQQKRASRWIDFLAGSQDFCGGDFHHRVHLPGTDEALQPAAPNIAALDYGVEDAAPAPYFDGDRVLDPTGPVRDISAENAEVPIMQPSTCKHTCLNKAKCAHICCKFTTSKKRSKLSMSNANKRARTAGKAMLVADDRDSCATTLDNLQELRRRARPLTKSLPLKRLRDAGSSSTAVPPFAGTRLSAFFQRDDPSPIVAVNDGLWPQIALDEVIVDVPEFELLGPGSASPFQSPGRADQQPPPQIAREDSYSSIFALLASHNDAEVERKQKRANAFNLRHHLEQMQVLPDNDVLTMPFEREADDAAGPSGSSTMLGRVDDKSVLQCNESRRGIRGFRHAFP
jgi:replicative superfamily II helicase